MKRILIFILTLTPLCASAQTYIKGNALYWIAGLPNVQVETRLGENFTFQGEVNGSFWTLGDKPMIGIQNILGARWYPKAAFKGFYAGGDFGFDLYKVSKWDHWNRPDNGVDVQHGIGYYLGITLGYQLSIAKRWNMDFFVGGGWHLGKYWGETVFPDGRSEMYAAWNASGEWIPYKIGVTFGYRLTSEKRMVERFGQNYYQPKQKKHKK